MKAFLGVKFQLVYCAHFLSYKTLRIFLAALSGFMYFRMNNLHKEDMNFKKIVAVDETLLNEAALEQLKTLGEEVVVYHDFPTEEEEVIRRIGNADCLLVSFRTPIRRSVLDACPNIRYIGMCCTLYNPESSNVDVIEARKRGITVLGVKDYGDEGVVEYVVSELVRLLHGFGNVRWLEESTELTGRKVGIIGLGKQQQTQRTTGLYRNRSPASCSRRPCGTVYDKGPVAKEHRTNPQADAGSRQEAGLYRSSTIPRRVA